MFNFIKNRIRERESKLTRLISFFKKSSQKPFFYSALFFAGLFLIILAFNAVFAWNSPTSGPPNSAGQALYINSSGNVGIGTAGPGQKLTVAGTIESTTGGIKFPDGTTQTSAASGGVPSGAIMFFNLSSCPSGWSEATSVGGRYIVGLPAGGTLAGTDGTALSNLEDRPVGQHAHGVSDPGHSHSFAPGWTWLDTYEWVRQNGGYYRPIANQNTSISSTGISVNNTGSVAGTNAPYIQFLTCQKN